MKVHFYFFIAIWVLGLGYCLTDDGSTILQKSIVMLILTAGLVFDYYATKPKPSKVVVSTPDFAQMALRIEDDGSRSMTHVIAGHLVTIKALNRYDKKGKVLTDQTGAQLPPKYQYSYRLPDSNTNIDVQSEFLTVNELVFDVVKRINKG